MGSSGASSSHSAPGASPRWSQATSVVAALGVLPATDRPRFEVMVDAAAVAMAALLELDLSVFDEVEDGDGSYGVWERMAPLVAQTQTTVHGLIAAVRSAFPEPPAPDTTPTALASAAVAQEVAGLVTEVQRFREQMRHPEVMSDRWSLLQLLGAFRGRARTAIGDIVYRACSVLSPVRKRDVVPGYREDVLAAVALRKASSRLVRSVLAIHATLREQPSVREVAIAAGPLCAVLDEFMGQPSYRAMRTADRRALVSMRQRLRQVAANPELDAREVDRELVDYMRFLDKINDRAELRDNDEEAIADAIRYLDRAREVLEPAVARARAEAQAAVQRISELEGRSRAIDELLAAIRPDTLMQTSAGQLIEHLAEVERALRSLG